MPLDFIEYNDGGNFPAPGYLQAKTMLLTIGLSRVETELSLGALQSSLDRVGIICKLSDKFV
jgi:hypothetical protein